MKMYIKTMHLSEKKVMWKNDSQFMVENYNAVTNYEEESYMN